MIHQIKLSNIPFIYESDLQKNVAIRRKIYQVNLSHNRISAFINIGGAYANIGTSELVLKITPGLVRHLSLPPKSERGVLFEIAAQQIPIIHLLYIRGLVLKYGLPWDPIPLPGAAYPINRSRQPLRSVISEIQHIWNVVTLFVVNNKWGEQAYIEPGENYNNQYPQLNREYAD